MVPEGKGNGGTVGAQRRAVTQLRPTVRTLDVVGRAPLGGTPLPTPISSFVGRERDLAELGELVRDSRLVTVTGAGGAGKTRLAIKLAELVGAQENMAARFVELAAVADPTLVSSSIAAAIGLDEQAATSPPAIAALLAGRRVLLVIDNCEHLLAAVGRTVDRLLRACPGLSALATSRASLRVAGERVFELNPLPVPLTRDAGVEELAEYDAVRLFSERARAAAPGFVLGPDNAGAVATLCRRLDGLPLAVELAAGRVRGFGIDELVRQIEHRLDVLETPGPPAGRTDSVIASLDWSYDLLSERARAVWRGLAVLPAGATAEAARSLFGEADGAPGDEIAEALAELVDHSILTRTEDGPASRYRMLDVVRAYGDRRARANGERDATLDRARRQILSWARNAALWGPDQAEVLARLDVEHANVIAVLHDATVRPAGAGEALALATHLERWWTSRGHLSEGRFHLSRLLECHPEPPADALNVAGVLAADAEELDVAQRLLTDAIELGEAEGIGDCVARANLAIVRLAAGDLPSARAHVDRLGAPADDREYVHCTEVRARVALAAGEPAVAQELLRDALACCERAGERWYRHRVLDALGACALHRCRLDEAAERFDQSLASAAELGDWRGLASAAESLVTVALERGDPETAARLLGAAEALWQQPGPLPAWWAARHDRSTTLARARLTGTRFNALHAVGAQMSVDEAWRSDPRAILRASIRQLDIGESGAEEHLSPRELQVLHLLGAPVSLREIAAELYVSPNTLKSHCRSLYRKLGVGSRVEAVASARDAGLMG